jgi:hypothetical protein
MGVSCPQYIASIYPVATEHEKHIWMPSPFPLWMVLGPLVHTCPGATKHGTEQQAINPTVYNQYILSSVAKCPQAKQPEHPRDCTGICPGDSKGSKVNIRGAIAAGYLYQALDQICVHSKLWCGHIGSKHQSASVFVVLIPMDFSPFSGHSSVTDSEVWGQVILAHR